MNANRSHCRIRAQARHASTGAARRFNANARWLAAPAILLLLIFAWGTPADAQADPAQEHFDYFTANPYQGTASCLACHADEGEAVLQSGHFKWKGITTNIANAEGEVHGKQDLINNFCLGAQSNEGRCAQCHIGYGYTDDTFDFTNPEKIDCLVCHDQTGTYRKAKGTGGLPEPTVDLGHVARNIAQNGGIPTRAACLGCHAGAGGGENVKHGDLSTDLVATTLPYDIHMATDGQNMRCVDCHAAKRNASGQMLDHGIAGMSLHSVDEGVMRSCSDCHAGTVAHLHRNSPARRIFNMGDHTRIACQSCHIPAIARAISTMTEWYWGDAGFDVNPIPIDPVTGRPLYDKMKGSFAWSFDVRPVLRWSNGKWRRMMVNHSDGFTSTPVQLATPVASWQDPDAMIYPFKLMKGNQPADAVNHTLLVPHLFGTQNGPYPYWGMYDWQLALADGAAYTGQSYSGTHYFAATEMLLSVNHEIAPAANALGAGGLCVDCHEGDAIDWNALGWTADPTRGGERIIDAIFATGFEAGQ